MALCGRLSDIYQFKLFADNLCKQFGSRPGPTEYRISVGPDLDPNHLTLTLIEFLIEFYENVDFEKNLQTTKKHEKLPSMQRVIKSSETRKFIIVINEDVHCILSSAY